MTRTKLSSVHSWKLPDSLSSLRNGNITELMSRHFNIFDDLFNEATTFSSKSNLPYNTILVDDDNYRIELALAGYKKEDINVFIENDCLYIETLDDGNDRDQNTKADPSEVDQSSTSSLKISAYPHYIHKGISKKYFRLRFGIPKNCKTFTAKMENGLLVIDINTTNKTSNRQSINID